MFGLILSLGVFSCNPLSEESGQLVAGLDSIEVRQNENKDFRRWLQFLKSLAIEDGLPEDFVDQTMAHIEDPDPTQIEPDKNQPEFTLTFSGYIGKLRLQKRHDDLVARLATDTMIRSYYEGQLSKRGSLAATILALWSIESNLGRFRGRYPVIQALATMSWEPRRRKYFSREFVRAMRVLYNRNLPYESYRGSWAGASGDLQFMPSNILVYGQDGDDDGVVDPIHNQVDAFATGVEMLTSLRWREDEPWGWQVSLPENFDLRHDGRKKTWQEWQNLGLGLTFGSAPPRGEKLTLRAELGLRGPAWLTGHNYGRILIWNRSKNYVMSVGILSDLIRGYPIESFWDDHRYPHKYDRSKLIEVQAALRKKGYYQSKADGIFGEKSRAALIKWERATGRAVNGILEESDIQDLLG